jgi:hypothetical protein
MEMKIRKPSVAGMFYPEDNKELREIVNDFLKNVPKTDVKKLRGLIVPHAGYSYSGRTAAYGYKILEGMKDVRVVLLGPSHVYPFTGASLSDYDYWETPLGNVEVEKIKSDFLLNVSGYHDQEHSIEVQLPFLQRTLENFKIIPIVIGCADPEKLADSLMEFIDKNTIIIASSDLSHYYPYDKAKKIDENANIYIPKLDIKNVYEKVEACGKIPILTLMHIAKLKNWKAKKIYYENSGDTSGDKSRVVGYGCYAFYEK